MTNHIQVLSYALVVFIGAMSPGPDFAIVSRNAALHGRPAGIAAAGGIAGGLAVNASAAVAGMGAVLLASPRLYTVIKVIGAAYLVYLGLSALWSLRELTRARADHPAAPATVVTPSRHAQALRPAGAGGPEDANEENTGQVAEERRGVWPAFRQGLLTNLLNPKAIIFLVTLMPQFLPDQPTFADRAVLAVVSVVMAFLWFLIVALAFSAFRRFFAKVRVRAGVNLLTGLMLIGVGAAIVVTA